MAKFRKKPVVIEAVRVPTDPADNKSWQELIYFLEHGCEGWKGGNKTMKIEIPTLEGTMTADAGDWIIRGVKGEFYPCKPDIFAATYESVQP